MIRVKNTCSSIEKSTVIIVGFIAFPLWFFGCFIMMNVLFIDPSNDFVWFLLIFPGIGGLSLMALSTLDLLSAIYFL
jgi:hypothetical protein